MATILPEGQNLDNIKGEGTYVVIDPADLDAGSYVVIITEGADADGNNFLFQRALNVRTGIEMTRGETAEGYSDWVSGEGGGGASGGNTALTAPLELYVNGGTGDNSNDGLTALTAKETIQAAFDLAATYDVNPLGAIHGAAGQYIQINVEAGTYAEMVTVPRFKSRMSIDLVGSGVGDVTISPAANDYCISAEFTNCLLSINSDFEFTNAAGYAIFISGPTSRVATTGCKFTGIGVADIIMDGGYYIENGATIEGDPFAHIFAQKAAFVSLSGALTLVDTPNFGSAFINASTGCIVYATYAPITGSGTGVQFSLSSSILHIFGGEAYVSGIVGGLPGDAPGTWGTSFVEEPYEPEMRDYTTGVSPITLNPGNYEIRYQIVSGGTAAAEDVALADGAYGGQRIWVEFKTRTNAADTVAFDTTNIRLQASGAAFIGNAPVTFADATFEDPVLGAVGDYAAFVWDELSQVWIMTQGKPVLSSL